MVDLSVMFRSHNMLACLVLLLATQQAVRIVAKTERPDEISRPSQRHDAIPRNCLSPSLASGQLHVVIASWSTTTCFDYVYDLGLTNAYVFVYRRVSPTTRLRTWSGPCGIRVYERLLLPNHGQDGAAFYDWAVEHYNNLPDAMIFLHGHGPSSWHSDPITFATRTIGYYNALVVGDPVAGSMITLTPPAEWSHFGIEQTSWRRRQLLNKGMLTGTDVVESGEGTTNRTHDGNGAAGTNDDASLRHLKVDVPAPCHVDERDDGFACVAARCRGVLNKFNVTPPTQDESFTSCCATFIMPAAQRIPMYPKALYMALKLHLLTEPSEGQTGRACFEYLIYRFFHEGHLVDGSPLARWYREIPVVNITLACSA